jgi:membrane protein CcdC involved in cytochrome C biogenesis
LLLALIALAGLMYSIRQKTLKGPVVIGGSEVPPVLLYTFALIAFIPLFYLAGASSIIGWILGSSAFLVILHSTLYKSEDESGSMLESP